MIAEGEDARQFCKGSLSKEVIGDGVIFINGSGCLFIQQRKHGNLRKPKRYSFQVQRSLNPLPLITMVELYRDKGLEIYERSHYSHGEHIAEVEQILSWYRPRNTRILDIGCSGGLHALEFAKRGFYVTGMDIEPSAIELAKKRGNGLQKAEFRIMDIEKDEFSGLGKFDLIYSTGNVLSHVDKAHLPDILLKIKGCLNRNGIFLFEVLINSRPFQGEIRPGINDIQITWKRRVDKKTGSISLDGTFLEFGFKQHFDVWGYSIKELRGLLKSTGFRKIEFSENLDFIVKGRTKNPISLYFRAKA